MNSSSYAKREAERKELRDGFAASYAKLSENRSLFGDRLLDELICGHLSVSEYEKKIGEADAKFFTDVNELLIKSRYINKFA